MKFLNWLIGGLIGGAIGAAVWVAIAYFANAEVGWIAWGIGFLVGFCVRVADSETEGVGPGLTAVAIACLSILGGKYVTVMLLVAKLMGDGGPIPTSTPLDIQGTFAYEMAKEKIANGEKVDFGAGKDNDSAEYGDYPAEIRAAAEKKWLDLSAAEQKKQLDERAASMREGMKIMRNIMQEQAFKASFSLYDILWFVLASYTAFQVGAGGGEKAATE